MYLYIHKTISLIQVHLDGPNIMATAWPRLPAAALGPGPRPTHWALLAAPCAGAERLCGVVQDAGAAEVVVDWWWVRQWPFRPRNWLFKAN